MKQTLLRAAISGFFIFLLFYFMRDSAADIKAALLNIDRRLCALAVMLFISTVFILGRRLQIIFAVENITISLWEAVQLTFVGYFFNNFLPTSVGGDIVKALCAAKITGHPVKSVTSVLMDRIFGLFTFIMIPSLSLLFFLRDIGNPAVPVLVYSFLFVSLGCFVLLFDRRLARRLRFVERILNKVGLGEKIRKIYDGLHNFKNHKGVIVQAMLLSVIGQSVGIVVLYLLAVALGAQVSIIYFFLLVPVVHLISMLPSINGLGIREGGYIYFLGPYIGKHCGAALGLLWLGLLFLLSLIGGLIYLLRTDYHVRFSASSAKGRS